MAVDMVGGDMTVGMVAIADRDVITGICEMRGCCNRQPRKNQRKAIPANQPISSRKLNLLNAWNERRIDSKPNQVGERCGQLIVRSIQNRR